MLGQYYNEMGTRSKEAVTLFSANHVLGSRLVVGYDAIKIDLFEFFGGVDQVLLRVMQSK